MAISKEASSYSSRGDVERCHQLFSRHRSKYSNKKLDTTIESFCEIAIAESNKRRREKDRMGPQS